MQVAIRKWYKAGELEVAPGDYWVSARSDSAGITLSAGGRDIPVPATKKQARRNFKVTSVDLHSLDGRTWVLTLKVPPNQEYSAFLQIMKDDN